MKKLQSAALLLDFLAWPRREGSGISAAVLPMLCIALRAAFGRLSPFARLSRPSNAAKKTRNRGREQERPSGRVARSVTARCGDAPSRAPCHRAFLALARRFLIFSRVLQAALRKGWPLNSAANRLHKLMRKRHRYSWASWLAAFLISVTGVLHGHDPGLSTAALKIYPDRLEAEMIFARADIEALVPLDASHDGEASPEKCEKARPNLEALVRWAFDVRVNDTTIAITEAGFRLDEKNNFHLAGNVSRA